MRPPKGTLGSLDTLSRRRPGKARPVSRRLTYLPNFENRRAQNNAAMNGLRPAGPPPPEGPIFSGGFVAGPPQGGGGWGVARLSDRFFVRAVSFRTRDTHGEARPPTVPCPGHRPGPAGRGVAIDRFGSSFPQQLDRQTSPLVGIQRAPQRLGKVRQIPGQG